MDTATRIDKYILSWTTRGYPGDIPDEVPKELMQLGLAPSYKAVAVALLQNDLNMLSLGFAPKRSAWYDAIKRVEIDGRSR